MVWNAFPLADMLPQRPDAEAIQTEMGNIEAALAVAPGGGEADVFGDDVPASWRVH